MNASHDDHNITCRIAIVDGDPLRARREVRELLAELSEVAPDAALESPRSQEPPADSAKGGGAVDLIGLAFSGGSLAATIVQVWLSRLPQRTISLTRPDGASLQITGREAREDAASIERFLAARFDSSSPPAADDSSGQA